MNLDVKFETNLDDFIEEVSPEYTLEPSLEKILNRYIEEFSIPSMEDMIDTSAEVVYSSFMEDFIDDFDTVNIMEDYNIDDSLYIKFSNKLNKIDRKAIEKLKDKAKEFRTGIKISSETEIIEDLKLPPVTSEIKEGEISFKTEEIKITPSEVSEIDMPGIIYESLSEEFVEDFIKGELKPYDDEEAMGIGLGIELEEDEEDKEGISDKETETSERETREIEVKESDLEEVKEIFEKAKEERLEEVEEEKAEEEIVKKAEEEIVKKAEEEIVKKAEEIEAEHCTESGSIKEFKEKEGKETKGETMPHIDKEIIKCKDSLKKNINKIDEVIKKYEKLYKECPSYPPLCCAIGSSYIKKGLFIEGVKEFMKTIDIKAFEGKDNFLKNLNG
jgi:hypothetical protein